MKCARVLIVVAVAFVVANRARATRENDYDDDDGDVPLASWSLTRAMAMGEWRRASREAPAFSLARRRTAPGVDGGPKEYGNAHEMDCGSNGVMTAFSFECDEASGEVHNAYACATAANEAANEADAGAPPRAKATPHGPSGSQSSGRNAMWDLDQHVVDCGNQFVRRWVLRQWSNSMQISYGCAWETGDANACTHERTERVPRAKKVSGWAGVELACPMDTFLSAFNYANDSFSYKCCPKPV